ncbi:uncharacterized protein AMSG_07804 [Thecamonas trahens ATCC 50062]|uniref:Uncharacterized protein n=1 Tax=Thecamonas trahens ATCC 50062 TaxID=461836 RepID=A0A0L0DHN7_THETB|nr:hypothetical protein AMSG_07804 [Thecamonas trahens ATCC 50062]KNC51735.1 hypothetical protein AMSG_07804 [Thecamonas trahens ATCC 50062]|eukprot:XP_013755863.1 hypothetical protein AMSG_07804 [Thecamonas trahens ATCC 50062]
MQEGEAEATTGKRGRGGKATGGREAKRELAEKTEEVRKLREALRKEGLEVTKYRGQVQRLSRENTLLRTALAHDDRDPQLMISFLNQELADREATLSATQSKLSASASAFEAELAAVAHKYEARILELESELDSAHYEYERLEVETIELREFKASKDFILEELDSLQAELHASRMANIESLADQEASLNAQVEQAAQLYQDRLEHLEQRAKQATLEVISRETRQIVRDNRRMANELKLLYGVLDDTGARLKRALARESSLRNDYDELLRHLRARGLPLPARRAPSPEAEPPAADLPHQGEGSNTVGDSLILPEVQRIIDQVEAQASTVLADLGLESTPE